MREQPKYKIPQRGITVWRIYGVLQTLFFTVLAGVATFLTFKFEWPFYIYIIAWGIVVLTIIFCFLFIFLPFPSIINF